MSGFGRVAVLAGGRSPEREISLQSGAAVERALKQRGIDAFLFDTKQRSLAELSRDTADCAFIALHGCGGEDGTVQGMLEILGIPFTGSGVLASALCMNKVAAKRIWRDCGIATPDFIVAQELPDFDCVKAELGMPVAVKPVSGGSSIGVSRADDADLLEQAWQEVSQSGEAVLIEQWISGSEYAVGFLNGEPLPPIRLEPRRPFYDYIAKYEDGATRYHCPCGLGDDELAELQALCSDACAALGAEGCARADVVRSDDNCFCLLEVNTIPGMTEHSLIPMAARAHGMEFEQLVSEILSAAGVKKR